MVESPPLEASSRQGGLPGAHADIGLPSLAGLSRALGHIDGVCYSWTVDLHGALHLEWQVGSIAGTSALPIAELLRNQLPGPEATLVRRHLDCLLSGNASDIVVEWPVETPRSLPVRDRAFPEFDSRGRIVRIVGSLQALPFALPNGVDGRTTWDRLVFEGIEQGLCCWDSGERLVLANQRFRDFFSSAPVILDVGLSLPAFIAAVTSSDFYTVVDLKGEPGIALGATIHAMRRCELQIADGRLLQLQSVSVSTGTLLTVQDITAVRSAERALLNAKQIAEQADLKKSRFLRAANHDLRQPLATLKILIYSCLDPVSEEHRQELLHSMDVSTSI